MARMNSSNYTPRDHNFISQEPRQFIDSIILDTDESVQLMEHINVFREAITYSSFAQLFVFIVAKNNGSDSLRT